MRVYHGDTFLAVGQVQRSESQFDGDAALLFFLEAIRVDAADRLDEAGFTVIDVSGGAEDAETEIAHAQVTSGSSSRRTAPPRSTSFRSIRSYPRSMWYTRRTSVVPRATRAASRPRPSTTRPWWISTPPRVT